MNIRTKIIGGYLLFVGLSLSCMGLNYRLENSIVRDAERMYGHSEDIQLEMETRNAFWRQVIAATNCFFNGAEEHDAEFDHYQIMFAVRIEALESSLKGEAEIEALQRLKERHALYVAKFHEASALNRAGREEEGKRVEIGEIDPAEEEVEQAWKTLFELKRVEMNEAIGQIRSYEKYVPILPSLKTTIENTELIYTESQSLQQSMEVQLHILKQVIALTDLFLTTDGKHIEEFQEYGKLVHEELLKQPFIEESDERELLNLIKVKHDTFSDAFSLAATTYESGDSASAESTRLHIVDPAEYELAQVLKRLYLLKQKNIERSLDNVILVDATALSTTKNLAVYIFLTLIIGLVIGAISAFRITRPVKQLAEATRGIAAGDFSVRLDAKSSDEVGHLARSFNSMAKKLQRTTVSKLFVEDIIRSMSDSLVVTSPEGRIVTVNAATCRMMGYVEKELVGQPLKMLFAKDEGQESASDDLDDRGMVNDVERVYLAKDGHRIPVSFSRAIMRLDSSQAHGAVWVAKDITERKQATEALKASESELRALFAGITDVIFVIDAEGRFLRLAPTDPTYLYKPAAKLIGRTVQEVFSKEQADYFLGHIRGALREDRMHKLEYSLQIKGTESWFEGSVSPMSKDSVIWIGRDITERKQAAQALIKSEERLQQSQKMEAIGTLAGGVAHDFNNLLTVILCNTELAFGKLQPADFVRLRLAEVEKAANRAAVLTRQLLAFSRRQHIERRTIDLNETIGEIMKLLHRIIGADVEVNVKAGPNLSAVFADPAQIEQVVMNLAINARDAMPQGGQLSIETSNIILDESYQRQYPYVQPGKYVQITVSDSGSGMDEETQARLFEPFFTTKEVGRSTGLGLSMVYGIVKQHDGHINVYSEVGHGTTFKIFLPIVDSAVEKEASAIQLPLLGGTETILVAEDEEALRNLARDVLEGLGYTVLLAKDGEEAVEMYAENRERIDMLLLDVVMPRIGGTVAYERMRQLGADVPLIFMTGYSSETVQNRFVKQQRLLEESGAVVVQKPYSVKGLGRKIREVLDVSLAKV